MASVIGTFAATGQSAAFQPTIRDRAWGQFNLELRGAFSATIVLERTFDGTNWVAVTALGNSISWTAPMSETWEENERGAQYRWNCTSYTSGTVNYRLSQ